MANILLATLFGLVGTAVMLGMTNDDVIMMTDDVIVTKMGQYGFSFCSNHTGHVTHCLDDVIFGSQIFFPNIVYTTPLVAATYIPLGVLYFFVQKYYRATSRELKRLDR